MTRSNAREIACHLVYEMNFNGISADEAMNLLMDPEYYPTLASETEIYAERPSGKQAEYLAGVVHGVEREREKLAGFIGLFAQQRFDLLDEGSDLRGIIIGNLFRRFRHGANLRHQRIQRFSDRTEFLQLLLQCRKRFLRLRVLFIVGYARLCGFIQRIIGRARLQNGFLPFEGDRSDGIDQIDDRARLFTAGRDELCVGFLGGDERGIIGDLRPGGFAERIIGRARIQDSRAAVQRDFAEFGDHLHDRTRFRIRRGEQFHIGLLLFKQLRIVLDMRLAEIGDKVEGACDPAVDHVRRTGQEQRTEGPAVVPRFIKPDDQRNERKSKKAQNVRQGNDSVGIGVFVLFDFLSVFFTHDNSPFLGG